MIAWIISFLVEWGYWGMLVAAFLAGSFFPFSSEAVMIGLLAAGLYATMYHYVKRTFPLLYKK